MVVCVFNMCAAHGVLLFAECCAHGGCYVNLCPLHACKVAKMLPHVSAVSAPLRVVQLVDDGVMRSLTKMPDT